MKNIIKWQLLLALFLFPAYAQENVDEAAESAETTAEAAEEEAQRPGMPGLFYTREQRRILEALRFGFVEEDTFEPEDFVPLVLIEETLEQEEIEILQPSARGSDVRFDAVVRNHGKGKSFVWLNGEVYDVGEEGDLIRADEGLIITEEDLAGSGDIKGGDGIAETRFEAKIGQVINVDGYVDERLPVIIIRKRAE